LDVVALRQFLVLRRQRLRARQEGFRFLVAMLETGPAVHTDLLRAIPAALREASLAAGSSAAKDQAAAGLTAASSAGGQNASSSSNSSNPVVLGGYHYASFCSGVGLVMNTDLQTDFQRLWTKVAEMMRQAGAANNQEMIGFGLACLGLQFKPEDHAFLCDINVLDLLAPYLRPQMQQVRGVVVVVFHNSIMNHVSIQCVCSFGRA
jgi:hypothetical protein